MVARAVSVLGDKEKRDKFDRFGTDPDSRFESARAQSSPFSGFGGAHNKGRNHSFDDDSPPSSKRYVYMLTQSRVHD